MGIVKRLSEKKMNVQKKQPKDYDNILHKKAHFSTTPELQKSDIWDQEVFFFLKCYESLSLRGQVLCKSEICTSEVFLLFIQKRSPETRSSHEDKMI